MQAASEAYKQSMDMQCRDQFYMWVTIGVINQVAQSEAYAEGSFSKMANLEKPYDNYDREYTYATLEPDFFRVDGTMLFLPKNGPYFNQGIVTEEPLGEVITRFRNGPYDIKGLTIDFGESYPTQFQIITNTRTVTISGNASGHFTTTEVFEDTNYIKIFPMQMLKPSARLRILKMSMGVGISFSNHQIKSGTKKEYLSWVSGELPTVDFSLRVKNENRRFDVENEDSTLNFLEIGQNVTVTYGKTLPSGKIEQFAGTSLLLDSWKASDDEMSFSAKDILASLNNTFYWGKLQVTNLYDLAVEVLTDAGLDERQYMIDAYLKNVSVVNPLPIATHAECLQMIANAGRAIITVSRDGTINLKAGFTTVVSPEKMVVTSSNAAKWANPQAIVRQEAQYSYGVFWPDFFKVDGGMRFLPRGSNYINTGFVSAAVADSSGVFASPPSFSIALEAAFQYYGLTIDFDGNLPTRMQLITYLAGVQQEVYTHTAITKSTVIKHEFPVFDKMEFRFLSGKPGNGVIVRQVTFGDVTDFSITYKTMTDTPVGERLTKYKNLVIATTKYAETGEAAKELYKDSVSGGQIVDCYLSNPGYGFSASHGRIVKTAAQAVRVDLTGVSGMVQLVITGKEYLQTQSGYSLQLNSTGETKNWKNPLVSTESHAALLAEWIGNYLNNNVEYDVSYRGDLRPDAGDIIFLQGRKTDRLQVFLEENSLDFNSGKLSGKVKARRAVNGVDAAKNGLGKQL